MRDFGKAIKYFRNKSSMTQTELAEKLSVSNQTVSKWETGVNAPAADVIADICNILCVSLADFFAYAESGEESTLPTNEQTTSAISACEAVNNPLGTSTQITATNTAEAVAPPLGARAFWGRIKAKFGKDLPFVITSIVLGIAVFLSLLFSILSARTYSAEQIYEKVNPSVVCIYVNKSGGNKVSGSGFYIDGNGRAVTNYHVIEKAKSIYIYNYKGQRYDVTEVVSVDVDKDIAVLQTEARRTPSVKIGNSDRVKTGEKVYAIGYPQSFILGNVDSTFTEGTVSKSSYSVNGINYIQSTVNITNGNSGGVLINSRAEVIGITTAGLDLNNIDYMNFSVPINNVRSVKYKVNIPVENFATDFKFYTVNYYIDNNLYRSYSVLRNEILDELVMPEEDEMIYAGWGKGSISSPNYDFTQPVQGNLNLYLKRKSVYYNVGFLANGGTGTQEMDKCRYENEYTLPQCTMKKAAYKFIGWEYNGEIYNPGDKFENSSKISKVNFTALWERTGYVLCYRSGANNYEEAYLFGEAATLADCIFTNPGYTFAGWEINGTKYNVGDKYNYKGNFEKASVNAVWEPISYTLILKNFSGETIFNSQVLYTDVIYYIEADDCKTGYMHSGWTDGNGNTYPLSLTKVSTIEGDTVTLTPIEQLLTYSIRYVVEGVKASNDISYEGEVIKKRYDGKQTPLKTITVQYGTLPTEPTLEDSIRLVFNGWNYYVNGELFTGDTRYLTADKNAQIIAVDRWTSPHYKIHLYKSSAQNVYRDIEVELSGDEEYILPLGNEPWLKTPGYNFVCWNLRYYTWEIKEQYDGGEAISNLMLDWYTYGYDGTVFDITAKFERCQWTIEFDGNGGEGSMDPVVYKYKVSQNLPTNTFTKEGYVFDGWEYDGVVYSDGATLYDQVLMQGNGTAVFRAIWKKAEESEEVA